MRAQKEELLEKLQAITNEFAVMKSDAEIVKQKARQMLIDKDEEIERMRSKTSAANSNGQGAAAGQLGGPGKDQLLNESRDS